MTEIISVENYAKRKAGFGKQKKLDIRIDMTPMVDLGFLLITFFIFTSAMNEPTSMGLIMPKDTVHNMPTKESGALTILPGAQNTVYYYEGFFEPGKVRSISFNDVRAVIVNKKARTPADDLFIIIKPSEVSNYKNVVDILDEMTISDVKRYALVKITNDEELVVKSIQ